MVVVVVVVDAAMVLADVDAAVQVVGGGAHP